MISTIGDFPLNRFVSYSHVHDDDPLSTVIASVWVRVFKTKTAAVHSHSLPFMFTAFGDVARDQNVILKLPFCKKHHLDSGALLPFVND
jgi:hypothetical protein